MQPSVHLTVQLQFEELRWTASMSSILL